jgi:hypothetical protein
MTDMEEANDDMMTTSTGMAQKQTDMEDENDDMITTLTDMVQGCEEFTARSIGECKKAIIDECKRVESDLERGCNQQKAVMAKEVDASLTTKYRDLQEKMNAGLQTMGKECEEFTARSVGECKKAIIDECNEVIDVSLTTKYRELEEKMNAGFETMSKGISALEKTIAGKDKEIDHLHWQLRHIKDIESRCKCRDLITAFINTGRIILAGQDLVFHDDPAANLTIETTTESTTDELQHTSDGESPFTVSSPRGNATSTPRHHDETMETNPSVVVLSDSYISRVIESSATNPIFTTLEELPYDLREGLMPFFKAKAVQATKEKLSDLQRAYVKYFLNRCDSTATPTVMAQSLYNNGILDRIWPLGFLPSGVQDFLKYLKQRIKNEQGQKRLKTLSESQSKRLKTLTNASAEK